MKTQRTIIGVIGSGTEPHSLYSGHLGKWLGKQGYDLINGGGSGVMEEVAKAFAEVTERKGITIGIIPSMNSCKDANRRKDYRPPEGYPNPYTNLPIYTHLHLSGPHGKEPNSRNHIIVLTADLLIAFPGNAGTRSEIQLAIEYEKPLIILNPAGGWNEFQKTSSTMVKNVDEMINEILRWENNRYKD